MSKTSGLGDRLYFAGWDIKGDASSVALRGGAPSLNVLGIDKSAMERIGGVRDGSIDFNSWFNDAASSGSHAVLSPLPTTDIMILYGRGATLGNAAAMLVGKQVDYVLTRGADGSLAGQVKSEGNGYGLLWGELLTAGTRTESTATNGASIDFGAVSTLFGLSAMVQPIALTSGSPTVKIQDSADNSAWADITGATFGVVAANTPVFIQTATGATVRRYVRVITTGSFSGLSFAVAFTRHSVSTI